jgi:hypothetical protein
MKLSPDKITGIYCIVDDMLKAIQHPEDTRRRISDSEVITTALVSAIYFGGHHDHAIGFMRTTGMIHGMLSNSRFCRRVHKIGQLLIDIFMHLGAVIESMTGELQYILDSFPVAACDNIRIIRSKLLKGNKWRGYTASMRRYFYGVKVQLLITRSGVPIRFCFVPGKQADAKALARMIEGLPAESQVYADAAYTDYQIEDLMKKHHFIFLQTQRKSNSKRPDTEQHAQLKNKRRKQVEAVISNIKKMFPKTIHAVTLNGFLIKLSLFIFATQFSKLIN